MDANALTKYNLTSVLLSALIGLIPTHGLAAENAAPQSQSVPAKGTAQQVRSAPASPPVRSSLFGDHPLPNGTVATVGPGGMEIKLPGWCEDDCRTALLDRLRRDGYSPTLSKAIARPDLRAKTDPSSPASPVRAKEKLSTNSDGGGNIKLPPCDDACIQKLMKEMSALMSQLAKCAGGRLGC